MVGRRLLSTVCGDTFYDFEDVLLKRMVLHRLLSTVHEDLIVTFEQACVVRSNVFSTSCEQGFWRCLC